MAKIGDEKPLTLIAISDKTLKATCLGFHVFLLYVPSISSKATIILNMKSKPHCTIKKDTRYAKKQ